MQSRDYKYLNNQCATNNGASDGYGRMIFVDVVYKAYRRNVSSLYICQFIFLQPG